MGYYTDYAITVSHGKANINHLRHEIDKKSDYEFDLDNEVIVCYSIKWYDWKLDMIEISKKFPETLILVQGMGEDNGDIWKCYFHQGRKELIEGKIVFADSKMEQEFMAQEAIEKEILDN